MKFVNPKNDVAFKKIFGSEDKPSVLIAFLNAVLDLQGDEVIKTVRLRNPYQTPKIALQKQSILDIYATDNRGFTFIVEMQVANVASAIKRFTYYVAKEYASQIGSGEDYPKLTPVIFVGIFDFELFTEANDETSSDDKRTTDKDRAGAQNGGPKRTEADSTKVASSKKKKHDYLSCHKLLDEETYQQQMKDLAFYFIELPKFTKQEDELSHILDKWVYFIQHAEDLTVVPTHVQEPALRTAYELANQFSWDQEDLAQYEYRGIKIQDERGAITLAEARGREEGREEGLAIGRTAGEEAAKLEVAQNLLLLGLSIEQIMQSTGLPAAKIQQLIAPDA